MKFKHSITIAQSPAHRVLGLVGITLCAGLAACSSEQLYEAGQGYQRTECARVVDAQERADCYRAAHTPYEVYKKEKDRPSE